MAENRELDDGTPLLAPLDARIEAAIFASERPLHEREIAVLLPAGSDVHAAVARLAAFWATRGVNMERRPEGWVMRPRADLLPVDSSSSMRRLSTAAGATLMTVAMHQPVTLQQIEGIRGVKLARGILESLESTGLVRTVGRRRGSGRAAIYEVTERFLDWAGLEQLSDLPTPEEAFTLDLVPESRAG